MIGLIIFLIWILSAMGTIGYYMCREETELGRPTLPRVIIALTPVINTIFCLRKVVFTNLFEDILKEFK